MNYKIEGALHNTRKYLIIFAVLWIALVILAVAPTTITILQSKGEGLNGFVQYIGNNIVHPFTSLKECFTPDAVGTFGTGVGYFSIIFFIVMLIGIIKSAPKNEYTDIEHGSSGWAENGEQYRILNKKEGIVLAENNYLPLNKMGNVNVLIVGGSGSGKSSAYSIPNAFQCLGSYVFTDPKGELYDTTAGYLKSKGYEIKVLNLVHPQYSDGYNPLMHITSDIDIDVIANTIIRGQKSEGGSSEPFWDDSAEMLLKALIFYLIATRPEEEQNLTSCAELVRAANSNGGNNLLTELMSDLPLEHPARRYYKSIEIAPEKTYSSILSTLQSKLGKFDSKEIAALTSTNTIDFSEIGQKKTAVYVISSDTHAAYDFLLTIFFAQMIQQLYDFADNNGGKLPIQTFFILDEFANIGKIPDFDKKISTSRSRNISFSVILQNLDQLEGVYEKTHETIIGNCDTHVFLGSNSQKTVEYFSKALGEKTITRDNLTINRDKDNWKQGKSESDQIMGRALLTADELRRFDNDSCIIFVKGLRPVKAKKFYYFKKPGIYKTLKSLEISHNDIGDIERGTWRVFNPRDPYREDSDEKQVNDLKIDSLDDLFEDDKPEEQKQSKEISKEEQEELDLQKELEAKFDELFGPLDDD